MTREQLLPPEVLARLPSLDEPGEFAQVKFFYPDAGWTWYAATFDGDDLFYGLVDGFERELGYFRLSELLETRGKLGCEIERDFWFKPTPIEDLLRRGAHGYW